MMASVVLSLRFALTVGVLGLVCISGCARRRATVPQRQAVAQAQPVVSALYVLGGVSQYSFEALPFIKKCEDSPIPEGTYQIRSLSQGEFPFIPHTGDEPTDLSRAGNFCMDLRSQDVADDEEEQRVQKHTCNDVDFQLFTFWLRNPAGCYRIHAVGSGQGNAAKYLQWERGSSAARAGVKLVATGPSELAGAQYWNVIKIRDIPGAGYIVRLRNQRDAQCIDFDRTDWAGIQQMHGLDCRHVREQYWLLRGPR